jgi:hypothetical protein
MGNLEISKDLHKELYKKPKAQPGNDQAGTFS